MIRTWYACFFALAVVALTTGGIYAFRHLESIASAAPLAAGTVSLPEDSVSVEGKFDPIVPAPADYSAHAAADAAWRQRHAREFSLSELRARGDGTRTARQSLQDRVYEYTRQGDKARAIMELERWVARNPGDQDALLWLARLLNETGRNADAITRYRQLLDAKQRAGSE
jgi:thioredoxin-like negative regulator of GroEL